MEVTTCPFCGSVPKITCIMAGSPYEAYFVKCTNAECEAEIKRPSSTEEEAIARWNARADSKAAVDVTTVGDSFSVSGVDQKEIEAFCNDITEEFGEESRWLALFLMFFLDAKTGKFPDYLWAGINDKLMQFIENHEFIKTFIVKKNETQALE